MWVITLPPPIRNARNKEDYKENHLIIKDRVFIKLHLSVTSRIVLRSSMVNHVSAESIHVMNDGTVFFKAW